MGIVVDAGKFHADVSLGHIHVTAFGRDVVITRPEWGVRGAPKGLPWWKPYFERDSEDWNMEVTYAWFLGWHFMMHKA